jgi:integrase/recombinase XerD
MQAAGRSPRTLHVYHRILNDLWKFCLQQIADEDIRRIDKELLAAYARQIGTYTFGAEEKRSWIARIKIFFAWCTGRQIIFGDPAASLPLPAAKKRRLPVYLTQPEIVRLLESIPTGTAEGVRDRAIFEMLYSCGLRGGEICRLTLADVSFADGTIRVLMSKNKKDRMVPIGKVALHWLDRYIQEVHGLQQSGPLFYDFASGKPLALHQLRRMVIKYANAANIEKHCHPRSFRHSFAIHMLEGGASIRHIQAMMGHACLTTTQKYTRIVPEELKRVHLRSHPCEKRQGRLKLPEVEPRQFHCRKK